MLGNSGRDLVIGGRNADTLRGGSGDDLLIHGTTNFDSDDTDLRAVLAEWTSKRTYAVRIQNLTGTPNPEFADRLNGDRFLVAPVTVSPDGAADSLFGNGDMDWLFIDLPDSILDLEKGEIQS